MTERIPNTRTPALARWAARRVDVASLVALRVLVGLLVCASALRFVAKGWVETQLLAPSFHFRYWGFEWVPVPGPLLAHALQLAVMLAALALAAGLVVRVSAALACFAFTWLELVDLTYYLNHYYFVTCLLACLALIGARADGEDGRVAAWKLALVRVQVGLVYVYAGLAKLDADWLLDAQPLRIWLSRHAALPLVGPWMDEAWLACTASWSGAAFDLLVVPALLYKPTRVPAYIALVVFHLLTGALFPIGVFPWLMIACATILFAPEWPRRWGLGPRPSSAVVARALPYRFIARQRELHLDTAAGVLAAALLLVQLALPWRQLAYPGPVSWHEQGTRYAYRVMLVEKGGYVEFRVHDRSDDRSWRVDPQFSHEYAALTMQQAKMMSTQPDMIAAYARHLAAHIEDTQPGADIEVFADVFVAVNGRPSTRLIDPNVDLAVVGDGLAPKTWILPAPERLR